jgi:catalase
MEGKLRDSPALSQMNLLPGDIRGRRVAVLLTPGCKADEVGSLKKMLEGAGAVAKLLAPSAAALKDSDGQPMQPDGSFASEPSITVDAVFVPGGEYVLKTLQDDGVAKHYLLEAYKHLKPVALSGDAAQLAAMLGLEEDDGMLCGDSFDPLYMRFETALKQHRIWAREMRAKSIPA